MMRVIVLMIMSCLMSACSVGVPPIQGQTDVLPPASLTQAPQPLTQPENGRIRTLEENHREVTQQYHLLAVQLCELIQWLGIDRKGCEPYYGCENNDE